MDLNDDRLADYKAISKYFDAKESRLSSDGLDLKQRVLRYFFVETFPELTPKDVTPQDVREFLDELDERGLERSSKRRYLEVLSAFYSWALGNRDLDAITFNPPGVVLETFARDLETEPD